VTGKPTRITNSIRALRFARGEMTQAQLSLEMAFQIAQVFQVPLDEVFQYPAG
jgi:putative transcriptional regulator